MPNPRKIQGFMEPLKRWQEVRGSGVPSWRMELLPEEEAERGEDCVPPFNARNELSLLGFLREFENEAPPPTRLQSQPSGVNNTPAGAEDPDTLEREEAPNLVEVVASTITPTGVAATIDSEARGMEDPDRIGRPGKKTQGLHATLHQPSEAQSEMQTRGAKARIQRPPPG